MIHHELNQHLRRVARRIHLDLSLRRFAGWCLAATVLAVGLLATRLIPLSGPPLTTETLLIWLVATLCALLPFLILRTRPGTLTVARRIERHYPELNDRLLTAIEQEPHFETGQRRFLQVQVIRDAIDHARIHDWRRVVSTGRLTVSSLLPLLALAIFAGSFVAMDRVTARVAVLGDADPHSLSAGAAYTVSVEPGNTEIERGTGLLVLARFDDKLPADATLAFVDEAGQSVMLPMTRSLDDPLFAARVPSVSGNAQYRVLYDDRQTEYYAVTVFDYPRLEQADAVIEFPTYTRLPQTVIEDTRHVTVVEGSTVSLRCRLNKPVQSAELRPVATRNSPTILVALNTSVDDQRVVECTVAPNDRSRYTLHLTDEAGRQNRFPAEIVIDVTRNQRPELKLTFPGRDLRASPLEELALEGHATDDFGLEEFGVVFARAGESAKQVTLGASAPGRSKIQLAHLLAMESLQVEPDELVSYYFFADDFGPRGNRRRTLSDMYFAEVRPFEEIFREGMQPPGGAQSQQQQGQQQTETDKLAELQKVIINATWALIRREIPINTTDSATEVAQFTEDVRTVRESQESAISNVKELAEQSEDPQAAKWIERIVTDMTEAVETLQQVGPLRPAEPSDAADSTAPVTNESEQSETAEPTTFEAGQRLAEALASEQKAYAGLLKLRAREHEVVQSQSGGGAGGGAGGRSQQQLNQLELSNKQNRYEQRTNAAEQQQQSSVQREQLQVLNRLRELARRQDAINEKLKELESELRQAETDEQRDEINRQLKRLREEQQQMLRDVDELKNRMDQPENQQSTADARQQVEQTRSSVRQASEALEKGQLSQALNAGTRAERELEQLRDDFRRKTANQFEDQMRDMRNQARELADRQDELGKELAETDQQRSLRYEQQRKDIEAGLQDQQQQVDDVMEQMKHIVEQAESSEPLLSRQLYDTIRDTRRSAPREKLELAEELLRRGFTPQSQTAEREARKGIESLRTGIEKAAEGVLGNDLDALKRARQELRDLARSLENEVAQADPDSGAPGRGPGERNPNGDDRQSGAGDPRGQNEQQAGQGEPRQREQQQSETGQDQQGSDRQGQNPEGQNPEGQGQQGEGQQGEGQQGEGQQGEGQQGEGQQGEGQQGKGQQGKGSGQGQGQQPADGDRQSEGRQTGGLLSGGRTSGGGPGNALADGTGNGQDGPITGEDFMNWSDRLRDVEEMLDDGELRADVAKVRDRARSVRVEFKRHSKLPNWELVRGTVLQPLVELQSRIADEIAKQESPESLVPIDRDPVPPRFEQLVRDYYRDLGRPLEPTTADSDDTR